ncbi:MAG: hypothetical protein GX222_01725 [Ruminococcaceae bacterium]|nr:hypothetical protein [Oscillospiraceae bacterium]
MSISNRIKKLIFTESRYFNSSWSKLLTALTYFLMIINAVLSIYNFAGISESVQNRIHLNNSLYLLIFFIILHTIASRIKHIVGNGYVLSMLFTSISFAASYVSSYLLFDTVWSIEIDRLMDHPFGFGPTLKSAGILSLRIALYSFLFYLFLTVIPAFSSRAKFLGCFYPIFVLLTISSLFIVVFIPSFVPEELKPEYAERASLIYLSAMSVLSVKFFYKSLLYTVSRLLPLGKETALVSMPEVKTVSKETSSDSLSAALEIPKESAGIDTGSVQVPAHPQTLKSKKPFIKKPLINFGGLLSKLKKPPFDSGNRLPILTLAFTVELIAEDESEPNLENTVSFNPEILSEKLMVEEEIFVEEIELSTDEDYNKAGDVDVTSPAPLLTHSFLIERTE